MGTLSVGIERPPNADSFIDNGEKIPCTVAGYVTTSNG